MEVYVVMYACDYESHLGGIYLTEIEARQELTILEATLGESWNSGEIMTRVIGRRTI